ncbi:MAG: histidinol-phosphatase [Bryobacterales bacterium]
MSQSAPWKTSLHGGHSGEFCEHAVGSLREVVDSALAKGFEVYGVSEHAPRAEERFLYPSERAKGYTLERIHDEFEAYAKAVRALAEEYADRMTLLCGFEAEVVPSGRYRDLMRGHRARHGFDYMVGSVHYVGEVSIDGERADFDRAVEGCGGLEPFAVRYYNDVAEMIEALEPDVVGHLDLIRKNAPADADLATPAIRAAANRALEAARASGAVLDLNTAGWRKGLGSPYPAPWLVRRAHEAGVAFCFGDDSHGPDQTGAGVVEARDYLLENGVGAIRRLTRRDGAIQWETVAL